MFWKILYQYLGNVFKLRCQRSGSKDWSTRLAFRNLRFNPGSTHTCKMSFFHVLSFKWRRGFIGNKWAGWKVAKSCSQSNHLACMVTGIGFWPGEIDTGAKILALYMSNLGMILDTPCGPLSPTRSDPWERSKSWASLCVFQNSNKEAGRFL